MHTVLSLPVVLDYPWWTSAGFFAAALLGGVLIAWRMQNVAADCAAIAVLALLSLASLWSGAYFATWSARLDAQGVSIHAPFDIMRRQGTMAWEDVTSVAIGGRRHFYPLRFVSNKGVTAELALLDLPAAIVPLLTQVVAQRTEHAGNRQRRRDYVILAGRATRPGRGITTLRVQAGPLRMAQSRSP